MYDQCNGNYPYRVYLSYGITVWGGVSNKKLEPLFKLQKKCMRILFGDKEAYLNKFETCARSRPLDNQFLGQEFYSREHTKPLFNQHGIMNVRNLHIKRSFDCGYIRGSSNCLKPRDPAFRLQLKPTCKSGSMSYCQKWAVYKTFTQ